MKFSILFISIFSIFLSLSAQDKRPNIIFLMSDDQSFYSLGCYGNSDVKTPNLDQLAKDGMAFDNNYATTAICKASRANVMTGLLEYRNGTNFDHGEMKDHIWKKSYPVLMRKAGYLSAFAGKFGFTILDKKNKKKGLLPEKDFDSWGGSPGQTSFDTRKNKSMAKYAKKYPHSTLSYAAFSEDFIKSSAKSGKPFTVSISFKAPHRPTTPDPQFDHIYKGKKFAKPKNYGRKYGEHFSKQSQQGRQYVRFHEWNYSDKYDEVMAIYHQQIYAIDVAVGRIRKALKENGVEKNTVIIFTSDNGFFCGSHGYGSKVLPYEESSRVPLIIYDPRHSNSGKQLRSGALTGNIDIAATMLSLAGLPMPEMDGKDLMTLYNNPKAEIHKTLPLINVWGKISTHSLSILSKDFKYIYWFYEGKGMKATEELYHTAKDGLELKNQVNNPEFKSALNTMRKNYDNAVSSWKSEAVNFHNYTKYGTLFDRNVEWSDKEGLVKKK